MEILNHYRGNFRTLETNQVDFYISGHDYEQYLKKIKITFLIPGAGSKLHEMHSSPISIFCYGRAWFLVITLKKTIKH